MKKMFRLTVAALLVGLLASPQFTPVVFAAASGNYTDLLPIGAAGNTTVISNGSGWSLTTLPPTQTFGDSLSRLVDTVYQSTSAANISNSTAVSTITAVSAQGKVGSTTFPAAWVASGRSIRVTAYGRYDTTGSPTWNWGVNLGTTSVVATGAVTAPTSVATQPFTLNGIITIAATGNTGTVNSSWVVSVATSATGPGQANVANTITYSTSTASAVTVDLTSQLTVNPIFTWGTASQANNLQLNNVLVEFLN